ncbi:MAG: hypothetical protein H6739_42330 [Alphaproteobacteria bacterium]|nr:hypothetical protein [Alphaproteobacteria bacterium]
MNRRAVVLGGGFAGLVTARVLADRFDEVLVLEQGRYPDQPVPRDGVAQGTQLHVLLARGADVLFELFPELPARLDAIGIIERDFGTDVLQVVGRIRMPRRVAGVPMRCATRPILEAELRALVARVPRVTLLQDHTVEALVMDGPRVRAARVTGPDGAAQALEGALFVDAMGRRSPVLRWLDALGFDRPEVESLDAGFRYATVAVQPAPGAALDGRILMVVMAQAPDHRRTGALMALPDGTWRATLVTLPGEHPERSWASILEGFRLLACPDPWERLQGATPLGPVHPFADVANRRRRFDRLARWPGAFVALGDAVCRFNPRFGQGMTIAALSASLLGEHLDQQDLDRAPVQAAQRFQRRLASLHDLPWRLATSDDAIWLPDRPASLLDRATAWYLQRLLAAVAGDADLNARFIRVAQMLDHPVRLAAPTVLRRVLFARPRALEG